MIRVPVIRGTSVANTVLKGRGFLTGLWKAGAGMLGAAAAWTSWDLLKPIAGAGGAHTYRVADDGELESVLPYLTHVEEVTVEEF